MGPNRQHAQFHNVAQVWMLSESLIASWQGGENATAGSAGEEKNMTEAIGGFQVREDKSTGL